MPIHIGPYAPYMNHLRLENGDVTPETPLRVTFTASQYGTVTWSVYDAAGTRQALGSAVAEAGPCEVTWDGTLPNGATLPDGDYAFALVLTDDTGFDSNEEHVTATVSGFLREAATDTPTETPAPTNTPESAATEAPAERRSPLRIRLSRRRSEALRQAIAVRIRRTPR